MPNARRCAASATNEAATVGVGGRPCAPSTNPRARRRRCASGSSVRSGPSSGAAKPGGEHARPGRAPRRRRRGQRGAGVARRRGARAAPIAVAPPSAENPGPGRRGEDVGLHEVPLRVDDVRQRRRQPGQHEPADAHHGQRARGRAAGPATPAKTIAATASDQHRARGVRDEQHPAAVPAVQQRAGERPEHRVRQQEHGEARGDGERVGLPLGVEQHRPAERGLEHAVAPLRGEAQRRAGAGTRSPQQPEPAQPLRGRRHRCG